MTGKAVFQSFVSFTKLFSHEFELISLTATLGQVLTEDEQSFTLAFQLSLTGSELKTEPKWAIVDLRVIITALHSWCSHKSYRIGFYAHLQLTCLWYSIFNSDPSFFKLESALSNNDVNHQMNKYFIQQNIVHIFFLNVIFSKIHILK